MATSTGGIHWYYDTLTPRLAGFVVAVDGAVGVIMERLAQDVEDYAQANAPWDDRTGAARDGLVAEAEDRGAFEHAIVLRHTIDYGIWLEVRWNGRFAIILPTIEHMGPIVMAELDSVFAFV